MRVFVYGRQFTAEAAKRPQRGGSSQQKRPNGRRGEAVHSRIGQTAAYPSSQWLGVISVVAHKVAHKVRTRSGWRFEAGGAFGPFSGAGGCAFLMVCAAHWFSLLFNWFSLVFISFHLFSIGFHWFSLVFIGFPLVFIGFH